VTTTQDVRTGAHEHATASSCARTGFSIGYGTNGFADHTLDDTLRVLAANGYGALALTLGHPHLDPFADDAFERAAQLRDRLDDLGWPIVVETGSRYLLDPFVKHRPTLVDRDAEARLRFLARAIELARVLEADCVSLWSGVVPEGVDADEAWTMLTARMTGVVELADTAGVRLGFEPEPGMLVETVADALRLREAVGEPDLLGLTVDLGHCVAVEPSGVVGALRDAGDLLVNVQVDDMMPGVHEHLELGHGRLDLAAALSTLRDLDYRGVAAIELPRHSHDAPGAAARGIRTIRDALEER
jgi:sugar phosphate isomerase/epimerase